MTESETAPQPAIPSTPPVSCNNLSGERMTALLAAALIVLALLFTAGCSQSQEPLADGFRPRISPNLILDASTDVVVDASQFAGRSNWPSAEMGVMSPSITVYSEQWTDRQDASSSWINDWPSKRFTSRRYGVDIR
jgi:hypothetical protein